MGKNKKRHIKAKFELPDEEFSNGPFRLARFGKKIVLASNWTEEQRTQALAKLAARYPIVAKEIDDVVSHIVSVIGVLPADQLLTRAWQEQVLSSRHIKVEADVTQEDAIALRMIDYVQSVIASAPRGEIQKDKLSDDDWLDLRKSVASLFKKLNLEYPSCSTAHREAEGTVFDDAMEEFFIRAQMHWCNVRGDYYQVHQIDVISDLLKNQSELIESAYGITSDKLSMEVEKIWRSLNFGIQEAMDSMRHIHAEVMAEVNRMVTQKEVNFQAQSMGQLILEVTDRLGLRDVMNRSADVIGGMGLFDLRKVTDLPVSFLDDFSWAPSQEKDFLAEGEFKGWPLRIQPIFRRPFLKFGDTYYCFETYSLFDNFYRQIEKQIFQRSEKDKQAWLQNRKEISETLPVNYLAKILPGAIVFSEVYYPVVSENGGLKNLAELDCIIIYDDHLFIVEVKAGAFTYTSPANDLPAYVKSLEALVGAPSKQGQRFLKYLEGAEEVDIFDAKRRSIGKLRRSDFRCKTICAVTLDPFTELAAQSQHLHKIGVDVGDVPSWPLSLSDLRVYSDIFAGPLDFLHFVEQRMRAAPSENLQLDDELDHLGLYFEHNNYAMYASELAENKAHLRFNGYRSEIDEYFSEKMMRSNDSPLPAQKLPFRLREVIDFLARQNQPHRSQIASYLLDFSGGWRSDLSKWIDEELLEIPQRGRCLPLSTVGETRLTIFLSVEGVVESSHEKSVEHSQAAMIASGESDRTLLELKYDSNGPILVSMSTVSLHGISRGHLEKLKEKSVELKEKRLARSVASFGKIGRNEPCPCGSGKKFKRCCMP